MTSDPRQTIIGESSFPRRSASALLESPAAPAIACGIGFVALYALLVFPVFPPVGDASDYANRIRSGVFIYRSSHIAYLAIASPIAWLAGVAGIPLTLALNLFAAVCMAGAIAASQRLFTALGARARVATLAAIILGTTGIYWYHAEFGEVQALLMLLVLTSLNTFVRGRPVIAGILFAASLLTSPASVPTLPGFVFLAHRQRAWRAFGRFSLACCVAFAIGVAPVAKDYFFGPRGVIPSLTFYPSAPFAKTIVAFGYRLVENQTIWLIPLLAGLLAAWRRHRTILGFATVLWLAHIPINLRVGHVEYGFGWMPVYAATALLAAIGADRLARKLSAHRGRQRLALATLAVLGGLATYELYVAPKRHHSIELNAVIQDVYRAVGNAIVVTDHHMHFAYGYATTPKRNEVRQSIAIPGPVHADEWRRLYAEHERVYVLVYRLPPSWLRRLVFDNRVAERLVGEARHQLIEEGGDDLVEEMRRVLPREFRLVPFRQWPRAELFRVASERANGDGT